MTKKLLIFFLLAILMMTGVSISAQNYSKQSSQLFEIVVEPSFERGPRNIDLTAYLKNSSQQPVRIMLVPFFIMSSMIEVTVIGPDGQPVEPKIPPYGATPWPMEIKAEELKPGERVSLASWEYADKISSGYGGSKSYSWDLAPLRGQEVTVFFEYRITAELAKAIRERNKITLEPVHVKSAGFKVKIPK